MYFVYKIFDKFELSILFMLLITYIYLFILLFIYIIKYIFYQYFIKYFTNNDKNSYVFHSFFFLQESINFIEFLLKLFLYHDYNFHVRLCKLNSL